MREMRNACKVINGQHEGKRPLNRLRHRWEGNIKMNVKEVVWCEGLGWICVAQNMI
jgi:hypothetical protein